MRRPYDLRPNGSSTDSAPHRPEKVKSRWRRNSELDHAISAEPTVNANSQPPGDIDMEPPSAEQMEQPIAIDNRVLQNKTNEVCNESIPHYETIDESIFLFERRKSKSKKETKKMVCDCILTKEERSRGITGCGDDCLNRMLMIECGSRCPLGDHCSNKRFSRRQNAKVEPFKTLKKGWGLRTLETLPPYTFIMEYVGEVIDPYEFHKRVEKYAKQKLEHHYFMALKADEIIDATVKGNVTRFINHSCEPNSQTQKWTVNGELRIGFFTFKQVNAGEEITFDYQFQRYGKKAQKCYCGSENCRGVIGGENANILTDGSKIPKTVSPKDVKEEEEEELDSDEEEFLEDIGMEEEINALYSQKRLRNRQQMLTVSRLMLRAEKNHLKMKLAAIIMSTVEIAYLRLFLDYHGLKIIWGWMVEADSVDLKARILELLMILPIPNKTMLTDSKIYFIVERWAQKDSPESEQFVDLASSLDDTLKDAPEKVVDTPTQQSTATSTTLTPVSVPVGAAQSGFDKLKPDVSDAAADKVENGTVDDEPGVPNGNLSSDGGSLKTEIEPNIASQEAKPADGEKKPYELRKFSGKVVIKSKSKATTESTSPKKLTISIGLLAQRVLNHWKDLKEVFRIPRLERQNRHKDEEEADRQAKEDEERQAQGLPPTSGATASKRSDEEYFAGGLLGSKRRCLKSLTEVGRESGIKRNSSNSNSSTPQFYINPNNSNQNSTGNKLTKEEHRKMFEWQLARSDYLQEFKKWQENLSLYNALVHQQQMLPTTIVPSDPNAPPMPVEGEQLAASISTPNSTLSSLFPFADNQPDQSTPALTPMSNDQAAAAYPTSSTFLGEATTPLGMETADYQLELDGDAAYIELSLKDIVPKYDSPLIVLSGDPQLDQGGSPQELKVPSYAVDNVDYNEIRYYSDDLIESMEKKMFDEIYPPEGVFYITPSGKTYFMALPSDMSQTINVKENVTEPLSLSFTKRTLDRVLLPSSWSCANFQGHTYYFNKRRQIKQWHPPQDSQIDSYDDNHRIDLFDVANELNFASNSSSPLRTRRDRESLDMDELSELKRRNIKHIQDNFRNQVSRFVVKCLNPFMRSDCKKGRITCSEDFKYLARKLTHNVVAKEMKQTKHSEAHLTFSDSVRSKTKEYVKKYMSKYGSVYRAESPGNR